MHDSEALLSYIVLKIVGYFKRMYLVSKRNIYNFARGAAVPLELPIGILVMLFGELGQGGNGEPYLQSGDAGEKQEHFPELLYVLRPFTGADNEPNR